DRVPAFDNEVEIIGERHTNERVRDCKIDRFYAFPVDVNAKPSESGIIRPCGMCGVFLWNQPEKLVDRRWYGRTRAALQYFLCLSDAEVDAKESEKFSSHKILLCSLTIASNVRCFHERSRIALWPLARRGAKNPGAKPSTDHIPIVTVSSGSF